MKRRGNIVTSSSTSVSAASMTDVTQAAPYARRSSAIKSRSGAISVPIACLLAIALLSAPGPEAHAQGTPSPSQAASNQTLKAEELDQLTAPIALYPDALLANVLMASTYPLEVVEADRWAKANKALKGDKLKTEADKQRWDDSVKQLVATASVLDMMSKQLEWTQKLGDAVLAQQADVMDSVQRLRSRAQAEKKLTTTKQQTVSVKTENNKQVVVIEPAEPNTVYVPYYDPATVYGAWPYPAYPPYSYPPYGGYLAGGVIGFGVGVAVGAWAAGNNWWGGGCNWGNNNILVNRNTDINVNRNWQHNAEHRRGVRYNDAGVQQKFGGRDNRAGAQQRMDFRGRDGQQVLNPDRGGDRGGLGDRDRPGGGDRAGPGDRDRPGGDRKPGAGDRKSGAGDRKPGAGDRKPGAGDRKPGGAAQRPGGSRESGLGNPGQGRNAMTHADRGRASLGSHGGGGGPRVGGGGGGPRMGAGGRGGGRGGGGGGGRRSDVALKHSVDLLGHIQNGLGFYRFAYYGSDRLYVGVMAQEVQKLRPDAVVRGSDGYLRVLYENLGLRFQTYEQWQSSGRRIPEITAYGAR